MNASPRSSGRDLLAVAILFAVPALLRAPDPARTVAQPASSAQVTVPDNGGNYTLANGIVTARSDEHAHTNLKGAQFNTECVVAGLKALPKNPDVAYLKS